MGRVLATSDWHGCGEVAQKVIDSLSDDDTLYFLGDAADRGSDGVRLLYWLLTDKRVKMLKGNHDDMFAEYVPTLTKDLPWGRDLWLRDNGGQVTWDTLKLYSDDFKTDLVDKINHLPLELTYKSPVGHTVIMEHAGYTPFDIPHRTHDPLWDRGHFYDYWVESKQAENTYMVHGHTPVQHLMYVAGYNGQSPKTKEQMKQKEIWNSDDLEQLLKPQILCYCDGHKFDLDMCTIMSKRIALLDLDTFEEIYYDA